MAQSAVMAGRAEPRRGPSLVLVVLTVSIALNLALVAFLAMRGLNLGGGSSSATPGFNHGSYYAIFLNNKEAFVGHVTGEDSANLTMSDIYYMTFDPPTDAAGKPIPNANAADYKPALKKLGNEVWGPKDTIAINRQNVEYATELKPDSPVVKAIQTFQNPKK